MPLLLLVLAGPATAQTNVPSLPQKILLPGGPKLERPGDREQREAALKADYESNLKDAARIQELAREIEKELKETGFSTMPATSVRKSEEIEKLSKGIKRRLRRL